MSNELTVQEKMALAEQQGAPMGFEEEEAGDAIIPRIKMVQTLSPEKKDKLAEEGDIINSLTVEKLNGRAFVPVFKFNNNILWRDRSEGGGIKCIARDAKVGQESDGTTLLCATCRKCEFNNKKQGKEAIPTCTKYINFFGFFEGERMPVILSFSKTNYAEGKKLYSLAKVSMQNMWNFKYKLEAKKMAKGSNEWFNIVTQSNGQTDTDDREFALDLYKNFRAMNEINFDMEDSGSSSDIKSNIDVENTEF